ncbi:response regulator transcription factor [Arcticibacterium luteifluviistationis]|uniref:DNA-binding response regulator n=1 Tax=Arcticibacterium luteifluviistationis TaxID=1784714 RepID=A0A2Z4G8L7_9BACT|nr:response regulator transcription factor [Arcticibacterium luteifluviistationis]AWV97547.1 DNA-binding response regulator [Arcticibacterium luteifluviistationis]
MKPTLVIADDHKLFNHGIREILSYDFEILHQVFESKDLIDSLIKHSPQLVLLDINLPKIDGFELAKEIKASFKTIKVVFLSMYSEPKFIKIAKEIPVDGYLLKDSTKEELVNGLKQVLAGNIFYDKKLETDIARPHQNDEYVKLFSLSPREIEIIKLIKLGRSSNEIANRLFLSPETIRTHRKNIHFKLGLTKASELIQFAKDNNI